MSEAKRLKTDDDHVAPWQRPSLHTFDAVVSFHGIDRVLVNHRYGERTEQVQAYTWVTPDCTVLELGGRLGRVSAYINRSLRRPWRHVVVEPDPRTWDALAGNHLQNQQHNWVLFGYISKHPLGLIGDGDSTQTRRRENGGGDDDAGAAAVPQNIEEAFPGQVVKGSATLRPPIVPVRIPTVHALEQLMDMQFDCLVADCEGALEDMLVDEPDLFDRFHIVVIEFDTPYRLVRAKLYKDFKVVNQIGSAWFVFKRE